MPDSDGGAVQFFPKIGTENLPPEFENSIPVPKTNRLAIQNSVPAWQEMPRWKIPGRDDMAVAARTKSEARAWFKKQLGELPIGFELERF